MYYFIRANGNTGHNDPANAACYVPGEPPKHPDNYYNGLAYCFAKNIVRLGWPDVGDLRSKDGRGALAQCYRYETLPTDKKRYLDTFRNIRVGSIILVPDKDSPGDVYIAEVTGPYNYFHDVPYDPYEHAHRFPAKWDRDKNGRPITYKASRLGIGIRGGFWLKAFFPIANSSDAASMISKIVSERASHAQAFEMPG